MKSKLLKGMLVVIGAIALSSIGLFAADQMQGIDRSLIGLAGKGAGICRDGMVLVKNGEHSFCIDAYEASPASTCQNQNPTNIIESEANVTNASCVPEADKDNEPWRFVSLTQAQQMCATVGKRLPSSDEWYAAALGTRPDECVITTANSPEHTGSRATCISSSGAYDMVGNVWEWVNETVSEGGWNGRKLPGAGYVASVDNSGIAITTNTAEQQLYGADYFWSNEHGVYGMIRGGFFGGGKDAGLYAVNASVETSFSSPGVGFRCVEDLI